MEHKLLVPVRTTAAGTLALLIGRLSSGERTGLAFTSEASLVRTLGPAQRWTDLSWNALLDMLEPLGIEHVRVDPDPDGRPQADNSPQPLRPQLARPAALRGSRHGPGPQCEQPRTAGADAGLADGPGNGA
jgi:hypothetical protein